MLIVYFEIYICISSKDKFVLFNRTRILALLKEVKYSCSRVHMYLYPCKCECGCEWHLPPKASTPLSCRSGFAEQYNFTSFSITLLTLQERLRWQISFMGIIPQMFITETIYSWLWDRLLRINPHPCLFYSFLLLVGLLSKSFCFQGVWVCKLCM